MSGRFRVRRAAGAVLVCAMSVGGIVTVLGGRTPASAQAVRPAMPQLLNLTQHDLEFILTQIKISEAHPDGTDLLCTAPDALTNPAACATSVPNINRAFGLRQTNGQNNNLVDGRSLYGSVDRTFPRLTNAAYAAADDLTFDPDGPVGPLEVGSATSYEQNSGIVVDEDPRVISNLISDQTENNPAAIAAAAETQGHGFGATVVLVDQDRNPDTAKIQQYSMPNVAPDAGLSASYNSLFTLFGQFFDHGLDLAAKGGSGSVFVPLQPDDSLYIPGSPTNFMILTRATNGPGPDGELGTADDVKDATNQVTPYIDNNQTYTSHPAHQVFLREYTLDLNGKPVSTGRLLDGADGGLATWADITAQAENLLGIQLDDTDVTNVPLVATDAYGRFLPGADGYPQLVVSDVVLLEGNPTSPVSATAAGALRTGHAFLNDIAHHAAPGTWDDDHNPGTPAIAQTPDDDTLTIDDQSPRTYDDEMLGAHYICGDGRCNENIGLTAIHDIFHTEHNVLLEQLKNLIPALPVDSPAALGEWVVPGTNGAWNGERLFQAAKFINEMEYQHIALGEFARAVQPSVNLFGGYDPTADPAITAEFAHAVYRFGHSMLNETLARTNANGDSNDLTLMSAFLNPTAYNEGGTAGHLTNEQASGSIIRGMVNQRGEEIDEFITEALRNNLVGLPLDLGTLNITRARSEGIAPLNQFRRELYSGTLPGAAGNAQLKAYHDWADFGMSLRHTASLLNFIAAYGTHPDILAATDNEGRRNAAQNILDLVTPDAQDFLDGVGAWANDGGRSITGLEAVDLWIGGLAEAPPLGGGMLGSTFNFVFETQMESLQDNDRMYYLMRNEGLPLLAELESNMFSDLIRRNTDAVNIPVMAFTRSDYTFDLTAQTNPSGIVDDATTPYYEPNLDGVSKVTRMADGTIRLTGRGTTENHTAWLGTNGDDKVRSAEGDDSLWGNDGNDRLEGGIGADFVEGNDGNDILTDIAGDDIVSGGNGNDVINSGRGLDTLFGETGDDAIIGGADDKETAGGAGDDLVYGSSGADAITGGFGEDWLEGGLGGDFIAGDNLAEFPPSVGDDDVAIGGAGDDRYHTDGGMDIMVAGDGLDTVVGGLGFDFASYSRAGSKAFANLALPPLVGGGLANPRDRFSLVEGVTGSAFDDTLRGDDRLRVANHELLQASLDKIVGLEDLLLRAEQLAPQGSLSMFVGDDMVFGAGGSDAIEGGGGNDFLEGDASLEVHLECVLTNGTPIVVNSLNDVQQELLGGLLDPGTCDIRREITFDSTGIDTAIYRYSMDQYAFGTTPDGLTVITHIPVNGGGGLGGGGGANDEGSDTLLDIEFAQFADGIVDLSPQGQGGSSPSGTVAIDPAFPVVGDTLSVIVDVVDPDGYDPDLATVSWQAWDGVTIDPTNQNEPVWLDLAVEPTYTVGPTDVGMRIRVIYGFLDFLGTTEAVPSLPTETVTSNVVIPASGSIALVVPPVVDTTDITVSATFLDGNGAPIVGSEMTFFMDALPIGTALTDGTGVATIPVVLTELVDTIHEFTAVAIDPAPLDAQFTTVTSLPETRLFEYAAAAMFSAVTVTEGSGGGFTALTATIRLDRPATQDTSIDWTAVGTTATEGADFVAAGGTAIVPQGAQSVDVTVDVIADDLVEGDERIDFTVTGSTMALTDPIVISGTITDDDLPSVALGAAPLAVEGPASTVTFELTLDQAPIAPVAVDWTLLPGSALLTEDYLGETGVALFDIGQQTATVVVTLVDDDTVEFDETFSLEIGAVTGATGPATTAVTATVEDDDVAILMAGPDQQAVEGNTNARNPLNFTLQLDRPSVHPISVSWRAAGGTASPSVDFAATNRTAATGTVTIPAGTTSLVVPVRIIGDTVVEANETVVFSIVGVTNTLVGQVSAMGTIIDDDTPPTASINNVSQTEGNSGFRFATFTITLSRAPSTAVSVVARTVNGTARAAGDYSTVNTTVRFAAGQRTATVRVPIVGDRVRETNETYTVRLSSPVGLTIARGTGNGTIVSDD